MGSATGGQPEPQEREQHPVPAVLLRDVAVSLSAGGRAVPILDIPTLEIPAGTAVGIAGPSGSGKTTLLNVITGMLTPDRGRVQVLGQDIAGLPPAARDRFRAAQIGYVFQAFNLLPPLTAIENVLLPMGFAGSLPAAQRPERAAGLLRRVGLGDRLHHRPGQLSHGEQQRVGIARALANHPPLIIADEPTASLEPGLTRGIAALLLEICREQDATLLLASHDPAVLGHLERVEDMTRLNRAGAAA